LLEQKPKRKKYVTHQSKNKKTCEYRGNYGHVDKVFYKKRNDLEENFKCLEGNAFIVHQPTNNFPFQVETSQSLFIILRKTNG
jgi:hypothetical protein